MRGSSRVFVARTSHSMCHPHVFSLLSIFSLIILSFLLPIKSTSSSTMWWTNSLCTLAKEDLDTLAECDPLTHSLSFSLSFSRLSLFSLSLSFSLFSLSLSLPSLSLFSLSFLSLSLFTLSCQCRITRRSRSWTCPVASFRRELLRRPWLFRESVSQSA